MTMTLLRWLFAYACSVSGDSVYFVTLSWSASRAFGGAMAGVVLAIGAVPRALLMLGGGVIADRYGPWRVLITSDLVRCLVMLIVTMSVSGVGVHLWILLALVLVFGTVDALFMPAVGALPPYLVPASQLARVQGMRVIAVRAANLCGPALAGIGLAVIGVAGSFAMASMLFGASLLLLLSLSPRQPDSPRKDQGDSWGLFREGLRYLRRRRGLRRLVVAIGLSETLFSGPIGIAVVLLVAERHWDGAMVGLILTAFSGGGAVAGVGLAFFPGTLRRSNLVMSGSLVLVALLLAAIGEVGPVGAVVIAVWLGVSSGIAITASNTLLQSETDPQFLGRVYSVTALCTLGLSPLLYPLVGSIAASSGTETFFVLSAVVCGVAAAICSRSFPAPGADQADRPSTTNRSA